MMIRMSTGIDSCIPAYVIPEIGFMKVYYLQVKVLGIRVYCVRHFQDLEPKIQRITGI